MALKESKFETNSTKTSEAVSERSPQAAPDSYLKDDVIQQLREKNVQCSEEKAFLRQVVLDNQETIKARLTEIENNQQKMFALLDSTGADEDEVSDSNAKE